MKTEIKLPELGENIETAEVLSVLVSAGDTVEKDQPLIELETDKATAEVPAESAGVVKEILVKAGEEIQVGQTIVVLEAEEGDEEEGDGDTEAESGKESDGDTPEEAEPDSEEEPAEDEKTEEREKKQEKKREKKEPARTEAAKEKPSKPKSKPEEDEKTETSTDEPSPESAPSLRLVNTGAAAPTSMADTAPAAPSIRRLARELGIDINQVPGSGPGGRISDEDVMVYARKLISRAQEAATPGAPATAPSVPELPDFSSWGEVEREPATKIRRLTAENMSLSWNVIPHVTQFDRADVTDLEEWRKRYGKKVESAGGKLTVTAIAVKVVAAALKVFPKFNSSYDAREEEIVLKKYVNLGVAVDTDRGLLVPVIRNADRKNIVEIAGELGDMAERARNHKIKAEELQGANLNISNLGGLGTTYFSPIVSWPQVAVVGLGRASVEAIHRDGAFAPRTILPLAVSYDHRVIDGADAARFLRWIAEALEQPLLVALEG